MPNPYITSATITDGKIALNVVVDDFKAGGYVEISGQATQTSGAFANFHDVKKVPTGPNVPPDPYIPGDAHHYCVSVSAIPIPPKIFSKDLDVTIFMRVARVWLTVLGERGGSGDEPELHDAVEGTTWDAVKEMSEVGWSTDPWGGPL
jgi:hypothetical protein